MSGQDNEKTARVTAARGQADPTAPLLREAMWELQSANEELRVSEEELRVQNEALAEAALTLDDQRRRYQDLFHASPEPSLLTDLAGVIQEANSAASALLGVSTRTLAGKTLTSFIAPPSRPSFRAEMLGQTEVREHGLYLQPKNGPALYATLRVSPLPDAGDTPAGLRWLVRGATPDPEVELARCRRVMAEVRDFAVLTLDAEGRITTWNAGAEIIFGWASTDALGRSTDIIFTPEDRAEGAPALEMATAAATGRSEDERWHVRKDGSRLWASGVLTALRDEMGGPPWYAKIVRDLTERRLHEQREHAVATQLQAAVQPAAPPSVSGLAVRTFYRPARTEASVGGDFFDVFDLGDGRTVLALGDVSGKGLEAASQVATARNMLRFALYNGRTVAGPISALNRTLAEHGLLTGFVTLFAGVFDPQTRTLTYVNCGQEPAILRRAATGQVEALHSTGALLGMDAASEFAEESVTLVPGDVLTVFTDGLTDIGPSRTQMLGEEGVTELLRAPIDGRDGASAQRTAELVASRLIGAVDAHEPGNVPDDVCLLVAVAE